MIKQYGRKAIHFGSDFPLFSNLQQKIRCIEACLAAGVITLLKSEAGSNGPAGDKDPVSKENREIFMNERN